MTKELTEIAPALRRIAQGRHHDPFEVLGRHPHGEGVRVRVFAPGTTRVELLSVEGKALPMRRVTGSDLFEWNGPAERLPEHYEVAFHDERGHRWRAHDPYCFAPQLPDYDLYLFGEGKHWNVYRFLGAHCRTVDGVEGVLFATWAPNAARVSVVGDFNAWDGRRHPMRLRGSSGVWELFIPGLAAGDLYKYELLNRDHGSLHIKSDPYGRSFEPRPATSTRVQPDTDYAWGDADWIQARGANAAWLQQPMSIYEVHLGSWQREDDGGFVNYRALAERLVDYVRELGYTHVELLPITEHPLDASWGYQTVGYFAPTSRHGTPDDLRYFIDHCHQNGIGVLLDWVPAHFPKDAHGLARYDGSALYEHEDPRRGEHRDWGTLIFNYGRNEVRNFLLSNATYWVEEFHFDGLRVDAVASLLYLDYSREEGDWLPNIYGGNENLEAIGFLRELNTVVHQLHPGALVVAEESTAWPMVSRPVWLGGLGFSMKWNMGWMHDSLEYISKDPIHRQYHHDRLTFGLLYAFTENFVLPFSHDEVVHGKGSMIDKMPGDPWQRFANLRLLYGFMFTQPGKKLLFMGNDFAQGREWSHDRALDWELLERPQHQGIRRLVADLNRLYRDHPALHQWDFDARGFEWIDCHDTAQSTLSYVRKCESGATAIVVLNFTPLPRRGYRIGVPHAGFYREVMNTDSAHYGGSDVGNGGGTMAQAQPWMGRPHSMEITLPPLAAVVFMHTGE